MITLIIMLVVKVMVKFGVHDAGNNTITMHSGQSWQCAPCDGDQINVCLLLFVHLPVLMCSHLLVLLCWTLRRSNRTR